MPRLCPLCLHELSNQSDQEVSSGSLDYRYPWRSDTNPKSDVEPLTTSVFDTPGPTSTLGFVCVSFMLYYLGEGSRHMAL